MFENLLTTTSLVIFTSTFGVIAISVYTHKLLMKYSPPSSKKDLPAFAEAKYNDTNSSFELWVMGKVHLLHKCKYDSAPDIFLRYCHQNPNKQITLEQLWHDTHIPKSSSPTKIINQLNIPPNLKKKLFKASKNSFLFNNILDKETYNQSI